MKIISNDSLITISNLDKIAELQEAYPHFFFMKTDVEYTVIPTLRSIENHSKMLIVDGTHCITGGTGIQTNLSTDEADDDVVSGKEKILGKKSRYMDVVITGPIAETICHEFYQLLAKWQNKTSIDRIYGVWNGI